VVSSYCDVVGANKCLSIGVVSSYCDAVGWIYHQYTLHNLYSVTDADIGKPNLTLSPAENSHMIKVNYQQWVQTNHNPKNNQSKT
jgi:hypothetical protein